MKKAVAFVATLLLFGSAIAGDEKNTEVVHPEFSLSLPGEWTLISEPAEDFWQYQSNDERESVSISLHGRPGAPDKKTIRRDLDLLVALRRKTEASVAGMPMNVGEAEVFKEKGVLYSIHASASPDGKHFSITRIGVNQRVAVVVFYQVDGMTEEERVNRGAAVSYSLALRK